MIIVTGCYRSGTSAIAGALHHLGIYMGSNFQKPNEANPKGYFEDPRILRINNDIHHYSLNKHIDIENLIKSLRSFEELVNFNNHRYKVWGFKDPKFCLTVPHTKPITSTSSLIVMKRDVDATVNSIVKAMGYYGKDANIDIWRNFVNHYNNSIDNYLRNHHKGNTMTVEYEAIEIRPKVIIEGISQITEMKFTPAKIQSTLDFLS